MSFFLLSASGQVSSWKAVCCWTIISIPIPETDWWTRTQSQLYTSHSSSRGQERDCSVCSGPPQGEPQHTWTGAAAPSSVSLQMEGHMGSPLSLYHPESAHCRSTSDTSTCLPSWTKTLAFISWNSTPSRLASVGHLVHWIIRNWGKFISCKIYGSNLLPTFLPYLLSTRQSTLHTNIRTLVCSSTHCPMVPPVSVYVHVPSPTIHLWFLLQFSCNHPSNL